MTDPPAFRFHLHRIEGNVIRPIEAPSTASSIDEVLSISNSSGASSVYVLKEDGTPVDVVERDGVWIVRKGHLGITEELLLEAKGDSAGRSSGEYTDELFHMGIELSNYEDSCNFWDKESRTPFESKDTKPLDGETGEVSRALALADQVLGIRRTESTFGMSNSAELVWGCMERMLKYAHRYHDPNNTKRTGHDLLKSYGRLSDEAQEILERYYQDFRYGNSAAFMHSVGEYLRVIKADGRTFERLRYGHLDKDDFARDGSFLAQTDESVKVMSNLLWGVAEVIKTAKFGPDEDRLLGCLWSRRKHGLDAGSIDRPDIKNLLLAEDDVVMRIAGEDASHFYTNMYMLNTIRVDHWWPKHLFRAESSGWTFTGTIKKVGKVTVVDTRDTTSPAALMEKAKKDIRDRVFSARHGHASRPSYAP